MPRSAEEILHALEAADRVREARFREMLLAEAGPEALARYEAKMKEVALGVDHAQMVWHSISNAQRRALKGISEGRCRRVNNYYLVGESGRFVWKERVATIRNLADRGLIDWDGGAFEPEREAVLSEAGRFLLAKGASHSCPTCRK